MRPEQLEYTIAGHPCLAQYPAYDKSAATTSPDPIVPIVPTIPAAPDPANDQDTNSQATLVPTVPCVPCGTHIT